MRTSHDLNPTTSRVLKTSHGEKVPAFGNFIRQKNQETISFASPDDKITHRNASKIHDKPSFLSIHKRKPLDFITHSDFSIYRTQVNGRPQDGCFKPSFKQPPVVVRSTGGNLLMNQTTAGLQNQTIGHHLSEQISPARQFLLSDFYHQRDSSHFSPPYAKGLRKDPRSYNNTTTLFTQLLNAIPTNKPVTCNR